MTLECLLSLPTEGPTVGPTLGDGEAVTSVGEDSDQPTHACHIEISLLAPGGPPPLVRILTEPPSISPAEISPPSISPPSISPPSISPLLLPSPSAAHRHLLMEEVTQVVGLAASNAAHVGLAHGGGAAASAAVVAGAAAVVTAMPAVPDPDAPADAPADDGVVAPAPAVDEAAAPSTMPPVLWTEGVLSLMQTVLVGAQRAQASGESRRWRFPSRALASAAASGGAAGAAGRGGRDTGMLLSVADASIDMSRLEPTPQSSSSGGVALTAGEGASTPPPRTCGCRFNASGMLAVFFHTPSPYAGLADSEAPRSYSDFQSLVQGWQLAPIVQLQRAMGGASLDAALWELPSVLGRGSSGRSGRSGKGGGGGQRDGTGGAGLGGGGGGGGGEEADEEEGAGDEPEELMEDDPHGSRDEEGELVPSLRTRSAPRGFTRLRPPRRGVGARLRGGVQIVTCAAMASSETKRASHGSAELGQLGAVPP